MQIWKVQNRKWVKKPFRIKMGGKRIQVGNIFSQKSGPHALHNLVYSELIKNTGHRYIVFNRDESGHFADIAEVLVVGGPRDFRALKFLEVIILPLKHMCRKGFSVVPLLEDAPNMPGNDDPTLPAIFIPE